MAPSIDACDGGQQSLQGLNNFDGFTEPIRSPDPTQDFQMTKCHGSLEKPFKRLEKVRLRDLALPGIVDSGSRACDAAVVRKESPWSTFRKIYSCELAGRVDVVEHRFRPFVVLSVRKFPNDGFKDMIQTFSYTRHENILSAREFYLTADSIFITSEHLHMSLDNLVACRKWPNEIQLASLVGQILNGITYLASGGYEHMSLTRSNILVDQNGLVKIAGLEHCQLRNSYSPRREVQALGVLAMELMEKDTKHDGTIGINDLDRWPPDSDAATFLSATTSAASLYELKEHRLLTKRRWSKGYLASLASFALISTVTFYTDCD